MLDPQRLAQAVPGYLRYFGDWRRYSRLPGAEPLSWRDAYPVLGQATTLTGYDPHYVHQSVWATARLMTAMPACHVDVSSDHRFVTLLTPHLPVIFVDYRPIAVCMPNLSTVAGDLTCLPFATGSVRSLSCLHVVEHIGLGRYGDALDPAGTRRACRELARVLAPEGQLLVSTPVGRPRVAFNGQRVHAPETIVGYFPELQLVEFSAVGDDHALHEDADLPAFARQEYACGLFRFVKPALRGEVGADGTRARHVA